MNVSDTNFAEKVMAFKGVTLVDFWAEWCYPCKMLGPVIEELESELKAKTDVQITKLNVDESPTTAGSFGIMSIPTMLIFKDGTVRRQLVGVQSKEDILAAIEEAKAE